MFNTRSAISKYKITLLQEVDGGTVHVSLAGCFQVRALLYVVCERIVNKTRPVKTQMSRATSVHSVWIIRGVFLTFPVCENAPSPWYQADSSWELQYPPPWPSRQNTRMFVKRSDIAAEVSGSHPYVHPIRPTKWINCTWNCTWNYPINKSYT